MLDGGFGSTRDARIKLENVVRKTRVRCQMIQKRSLIVFEASVDLFPEQRFAVLILDVNYSGAGSKRNGPVRTRALDIFSDGR